MASRVTSAQVRAWVPGVVSRALLDAISATLAEYEPIVAAYEAGTMVWSDKNAVYIEKRAPGQEQPYSDMEPWRIVREVVP